MHIEHYEKYLRYTDRELLLLARKVGSLATRCKRLKDASSSIRIEAERRATKKKQDSVKVTMTIELPQKILRAESRKPTVLEAIDRCTQKLMPQIARYKDLHS
ncbi:hypothetical protein COU77_03105 [Candidatus Peregrinibacteria bacterium CG10_big_fil_rev_8_21_14_0_10_49_16]|nr:MAG: hypothetical protein COW95_02620 [Candidatus Peregrinibacteria bacterium CG22_combo_CG10-13_8_21_14_all_49_11]PIR52022.1 MAG: hypothetical protein COU77_03105 [Candidatus Peregrinibacteria bacterium CG10_big_fil_rev_8_21_14_0_10_49_16]